VLFAALLVAASLSLFTAQPDQDWSEIVRGDPATGMVALTFGAGAEAGTAAPQVIQFAARDGGGAHRARARYRGGSSCLAWSAVGLLLCTATVAATVAVPFLIPFAPGCVTLIATWVAARTFRHVGLPWAWYRSAGPASSPTGDRARKEA
jgi:hypothetical protein